MTNPESAANALKWANEIVAIFYEDQPDEPDYEERRVAEIVLRIQEETGLKTVAAIASNTIDVRSLTGRAGAA
jgi:hypothetical protein